MKIYPAIDLINGKVVRLFKGQFESKKTYADDPLNVAKSYVDAGASYLHIIDLDGAKNCKNRQIGLIKDLIRSTPLKIQVGGGIRAVEGAKELIDIGVDKIILGSVIIKDPEETDAIISQVGGANITLGLDVVLDQNGVPRVAIDGWQKIADESIYDVLSRFSKSGVKTVLCTDVSKDGTLAGPNFDLYGDLVKKYGDFRFLASGGISSWSDLPELKGLGVGGVVIGKALYEGVFTLEEALKC